MIPVRLFLLTLSCGNTCATRVTPEGTSGPSPPYSLILISRTSNRLPGHACLAHSAHS
ncbi:uncharacterized protein FOMMEDRAFT_138527 [Fomitiporia mediterranea MF3/22]|uniref:uncharacterized protein n=1 Tax=Fomitiporia mediterranea (strain MF3/22) TaxID=694068 RepID=UPI00044072D9|nr:uncharacterized protein FOMMEDRAFT_138527 [Fomitiporia mediterranea MF3/22]EJD06652.1 hypothetical protein FOMMEDRAFT_138527 [Fomitiporia mediterranea MF3/22]